MQIIKKINTSAALALDKTGHEIVVMGKGIGFPPVPYELNDLSKIERTFYDVDPKYLSMIAELSQPIVMWPVRTSPIRQALNWNVHLTRICRSRWPTMCSLQ